MFSHKITTSCKAPFIDTARKIDSTISVIIDPTSSDFKETLIEKIQLTSILNRKITQLSRGELQRFCIAITTLKSMDVYLFDKSTSYLDY